MQLESKEMAVCIQNNHKRTFIQIISLEQSEKILSFKKYKPKSKPNDYLDVVAKIHINKKNERNRSDGSKDSIQKFIDRFKNVEHIKVHFGLYSHETHELGLNGTGDLLATNNPSITDNYPLNRF